jgi:hypothetical protein
LSVRLIRHEDVLGSKVIAQSFLTSSLHGGEWLVKVMLRQMVSRPVLVSKHPSGAEVQIFITVIQLQVGARGSVVG